MKSAHKINFDELAKTILDLASSDIDKVSRARLLSIYQSIEDNVFVELQTFLTSIFHGARTGSFALGKNARIYEVKVPRLMAGMELQNSLRNIFLHLMRDSLDHVFGSEAERLQKAMESKSKFEIQGRIIGKWVEFCVQDEARVLHLAKLKLLAASKGFGYSDLETLADVIFLDEETKSEERQGLASLRKLVSTLGGTIHVILLGPHQLISDLVPFGFRINLPLDHFFLPLQFRPSKH